VTSTLTALADRMEASHPPSIHRAVPCSVSPYVSLSSPLPATAQICLFPVSGCVPAQAHGSVSVSVTGQQCSGVPASPGRSPRPAEACW
jgi:hypothetical protein